MSGLMIAAPSSGAGKTTITLGLLRALRDEGVALAPGKAGPDYIDPAFHTAASGTPCMNFDPWGMRPELLAANAELHASGDRLLLVEAMMGLFDAAVDRRGSPADLAGILGLSVVLVVDAARMSHSVAALVAGFAGFRGDTRIAGVILNRVASDRHENMLREALADIRMPVLGIVRRDAGLVVPERHLGLVQAGEHGALDAFIDRAAKAVSAHCDLDAFIHIAQETPEQASPVDVIRLPPLGRRIAVARDLAFAFSYEHILSGWRRQGVEISFFSPLADEAPSAVSDAVYLPGGYPELHAGRLASASVFRQGMMDAAARGARVFGECGGYMTLGEGLIDAKGVRHEMLGLLPVVTSFEKPVRHLGYRRLTPLDARYFSRPMTGHEYHYSSVVHEGDADRLFDVTDAVGRYLGSAGLVRGSVAGSFMHLIDIGGEGA